MRDCDYPALYEAANVCSIANQKYFFRTLLGTLVTSFLAAILSQIEQYEIAFGYSQVAVLICGLGCIIYLGSKQPQRTWYGARALAESVKTISWRYMMRAEPYHVEDNLASIQFAEALKRLLNDNIEISSQALHQENRKQITDTMKAKRELSLEERKEFYLSKRIGDQLFWYQKKAKLNKKIDSIFFWILITVNAAAISTAILKISSPSINFPPVEIFIVLAGSFMAWSQAKRFQDLSASYTLTAHEIGILQATIPNEGEENTFSLFVSDAENAFSREHIQWQARKDQ